MGDVLGLLEQRACEILKNCGSLDGHDLDGWMQAESELFQPVTAELSDAGDAFIIVRFFHTVNGRFPKFLIEPAVNLRYLKELAVPELVHVLGMSLATSQLALYAGGKELKRHDSKCSD